MASQFAPGFVDGLNARLDIVKVIGARVSLQQVGGQYRACCPFHEETTASFWVSPDKQFYHCFGCGAHGTALGFVISFEHLSLADAVSELSVQLDLPSA